LKSLILIYIKHDALRIGMAEAMKARKHVVSCIAREKEDEDT
jgi:hypothetical protein